MTIRQPDDPAFELTTQELANLLQVHVRTVPKLHARGMPRLRPGRWLLRDVLPWLIEGDPIKASEAAPTYMEARTNLAVAQRERTETETRRLQNHLLEYDEVLHCMMALVQVLIGGLESLAPRLGSRLAAIDTAAEVEHELDAEVRELRNRLSAELYQFEADYPLDGPNDSGATPAQLPPVGGPAPSPAPGRTRAGAVA